MCAGIPSSASRSANQPQPKVAANATWIGCGRSSSIKLLHLPRTGSNLPIQHQPAILAERRDPALLAVKVDSDVTMPRASFLSVVIAGE
jgi:hypothetical protein